VIGRLKLIEDAQYEAEVQYMREKKRKDREYMNFVSRSRYSSISVSKIPPQRQRLISLITDSAESKSIREMPNMSNNLLIRPMEQFYFPSNQNTEISVPYAKRVEEILTRTKS
jgi:hypothetical protein